MTPEYFIRFGENREFINTSRKVDNCGISGRHQPPFGPEMRINNENSVAVRVWAHSYLLNQRMIIRMGALENKRFSCKSSNLTFFVFIGTIHRISCIPTFGLQAPVRAVKAIGAERKGTRWLSHRIKT
jgi:hypothetical protein